jgi:hypothetical protein
LPSACLKIGKLLRDPCTIVEKKFSKNSSVSVHIVADALARSYGQIPVEYPIFGKFLQVMKRFNVNGKMRQGKTLLESWKPNIEICQVDRNDCLDAINRRYGITPLDVARVEAMLDTIQYLPAYIEDPVFDMLCACDY